MVDWIPGKLSIFLMYFILYLLLCAVFGRFSSGIFSIFDGFDPLSIVNISHVFHSGFTCLCSTFGRFHSSILSIFDVWSIFLMYFILDSVLLIK